jgi:phage I-like protein
VAVENRERDVQQVEREECLAIQSTRVSASTEARQVLIAPFGEVRSSNGDFVMDEAAARMVVAHFNQQGTDIPVDYEHQSLGGAYSSPSGQAPAAGWIRQLHFVEPEGEADRPAGLYAKVEWTEAGQEKLAKREYRYLSPVVMVRKDDRRVASLHSVALTNKPAIRGMRPIVNREEAAEGNERLSEDEALVTLREQLGMDAENDAAAVMLAASERLAALHREAAGHDAEKKVNAAMRAGKLLPSQREWATTLALKDPEGFDAWAAQAPQVFVMGKTSPPQHGGNNRRQAVIASARAAYNAHPELAQVTSETAWVADALRQEGMDAHVAKEDISEA